MSEAPKRIWARVSPDWHCGETGEYFVGGMFDAGHFKDGQKYIRADLVEAAVKRALEEAAKRCDAELINTAMLLPYPLQSSAAWNAANCIRALDPAQFIEEPKE